MKKFLSQGLKFYIVGGTGVVINLGILYLLTNLNIWYFYAAVIGVIASVTTNFFGNKIWTFKYKRSNSAVQYIKFWLASLLGIVIQLSFLYFLVEYFELWYISSALIAILIASFSNFLLSKFWVFK